MKRRWILLAVLGPMACACRADDYCSYKNSSQLVWNKAFTASIHAFFGNQRSSYFGSDAKLSEVALEGLGGPPNDLMPLGKNLVLVSACRVHDCQEKAAAIIACPSTILAVGIIHRDIFDLNKSFPHVAGVTLGIVTIFVSDHNPKQLGLSTLEAWGKDQTERYGESHGVEYRSQSNNRIERTREP